MGCKELLPLGEEVARAFDVCMKLYIKRHQDQSEEECLWNGRNNWGKLTKEQKKLFAVQPKTYAIKKRPIPKKKPLPKPGRKTPAKDKAKAPKKTPIKKKKQPTKPKTLLGRPPKPQGRKLTIQKQTKKN